MTYQPRMMTREDRAEIYDVLAKKASAEMIYHPGHSLEAARLASLSIMRAEQARQLRSIDQLFNGGVGNRVL